MARFAVRVPFRLAWLQTPSFTARACFPAFDRWHSLRRPKIWRFEPAVAFLSFFCIAPRLNAATTQQFTITKDPQAIAVAQKALAAMGGAQALLAYQDSQATGNYTVYGGLTPTTYPITLKCKGTQETRVELQKPSGTAVRVVNQGQGAISRPDGSVIHLLMNNTLAERVNHIPLLSILAEYQNGNISIQYQGTAAVGGQTADVVAVSLVPTTDAIQGPLFAATTQTMFYVDQTTGLIDKIQFTNYAENDPNSPQRVEVYLGSWESVNGISVPFHQTTYTDGNMESDLVLSSVSFNVGLADSEFVLPQ
jgi:hypothetical protein